MFIHIYTYIHIFIFNKKMNIRNINIKKTKSSRIFIILFIIYSLTIYISEIFYRDSLFDISLDLISSLNSNDCIFSSVIPILDAAGDFLGSYKLFGIVLLFVYTWANIYKTFILMLSFLSSYYISGVLKIFYHEPVMYYMNNNRVEPLTCYGGWGSPSSTSIATTCMYLTLWKIIFDCSRLRFKNKAKIISLIFLIILIILINTFKFLAAVHSINQIIFGCSIGLQIFFLLFYVIKVDLNNSRNLIQIVTFKLVYYLLINLFLALGILLPYFLINPEEEMSRYNKVINNSQNCSHIRENLRFNNDALFLASMIFSNVGLFLGMKCEYYFTFQGKEHNWRQYNFDKEESEEDSLLSRLSIARETQWNHTTFFFFILRLIVVTIISAILLLPSLFIGFSSNVLIVAFFKIIVPFNAVPFFMFYVNKIILRKMALSNDSLFQLLSDDGL
jgi:hypothetical protein